MNKAISPVVFNVITIVALLYCVYQVAVVAPENTMPATNEALLILREVAGENDAVDETLPLRLAKDQERRRRLSNYLVVTMSIAVLANAFANRLGRQRQKANASEIRNLEAELRGVKSRRASNEG